MSSEGESFQRGDEKDDDDMRHSSKKQASNHVPKERPNKNNTTQGSQEETNNTSDEKIQPPLMPKTSYRRRNRYPGGSNSMQQRNSVVQQAMEELVESEHKQDSSKEDEKKLRSSLSGQRRVSSRYQRRSKGELHSLKSKPMCVSTEELMPSKQQDEIENQRKPTATNSHGRSASSSANMSGEKIQPSSPLMPRTSYQRRNKYPGRSNSMIMQQRNPVVQRAMEELTESEHHDDSNKDEKKKVRSSLSQQRRLSSRYQRRNKREAPPAPESSFRSPVHSSRKRFLRTKTPTYIDPDDVDDDEQQQDIETANDVVTSNDNLSMSQPGAYAYHEEDASDEENGISTVRRSLRQSVSSLSLQSEEMMEESEHDPGTHDTATPEEDEEGGFVVATQVTDATPVVYPTHVEKFTGQQQGKTGKGKYYITFFAVMVVLVVLGAGLAVGLLVSKQQGADEEPAVDRCQTPNPNVLVQCACNDTITTLSQEQITGYQNITDLLWEHGIIERDAPDNITSCVPSTISRLTMSETTFSTIQDLTTRFVLGVLYAEWGGNSWNNNNGWLDLNYRRNRTAERVVLGGGFGSDDEEGDGRGGGSMVAAAKDIRKPRNSFCTWHGVKCNFRNELSSLTLSKNNLRGSIPMEIGFLTSLRLLNLGKNQLEGEVPTEAFRNLTSLVGLYLHDNRLKGRFLEGWIDNMLLLRDIRMEQNLFTGSIPTQLGALVKLRSLQLNNNKFLSGSIPSEIGLLEDLELLSMSKCNLTGSIPTQLGMLADLNELILTTNALTGTIPTEFVQMSSLQAMVLIGNPWLQGGVPEEVCDLVFLSGILATCSSDNDIDSSSSRGRSGSNSFTRPSLLPTGEGGLELDDCPCCYCVNE